MFTRFKTLTLFLIFCVSFALATIFLGPSGVLARKALIQEQEALEKVLFDKEAELENLRERNVSGRDSSVYGKDLVYEFGPKAIYEPEKEEVREVVEAGFTGFSTFRLFLVALVPTGIYLIILILLYLRSNPAEKEVEEEKEKARYDRYND